MNPSPSPKPPVPAARKTFLLYLAVFCISAGVYLNTIPYGFVYDDYCVFTGNAYVQKGIAGIPEILSASYWSGIGDEDLGYYRPLSLVMFAVEHHVFPGNASASHAVNVLLYALSCVVGLWLLRELFPGAPWWAGLAAMLVFAVHPVHTEAVANIKSRDEILCFLGLALSLSLWARYLRSRKPVELALSAVCFMLSLLSKENAVAFFGLAPMAGLVVSKPQIPAPVKTKSRALTLMALVPMALILAGYLAFKVAVLGGAMGARPADMLAYPLYGVPFWGTVVPTAVNMFRKYLQLLFIPHPLVYDYSFNQFPARGWGDMVTIASVAAVLGVVVAAIWLFKRNKMASFGAGFFAVALGMPLAFTIVQGGIMGERFLLTPSFGFCAGVAGIAWWLTETKRFSAANPGFRKNVLSAAVGIFIAVLAALAGSTVLRNRVWKDSITLYSSEVRHCAGNARAHFNFGSEIVNNIAKREPDPVKQKRLLESAVVELQKAIAIHPKYSAAHNNLGIAYSSLSRWDDAIPEFRLALSIDPQNLYPYNNLGNAYLVKRDFRAASQALQEALDRGLKHPIVYYNLGNAFLGLGKEREAVSCFETALRLDPAYEKPYIALGNYYAALGRRDKAEEYKKLLMNLRKN